MTEYEKAIKTGMAEEHYSFKDTGIVILNLGEDFCGYVYPDQKTVEVTHGNQVVWYGNISDDLKSVECTRHNRIRTIEPW